MFNLFKTKCPLDLYERAWLEFHWRWLGEHIGWESMLNARTFLPEDIPFSASSELTEQEAVSVFEFVAESMEIAPSQVQFTIVPEDQWEHTRASGMYFPRETTMNPSKENGLVHICDSQLRIPNVVCFDGNS